MQCVQGTAMRPIAVLFVFGILLGWGLPAHGQPGAEPLDWHLVRTAHESESPVLRFTMRGADASAFPVFYGAPIAAWGGAALFRDTGDFTDAYRLTVTSAAAYGAVVGLKVLIQRPRPYRTVPGITARKAKYQVGGAEYRSFAMPSGHAALSFALAASWSLSHPRWYVIAPGAAWATSVALSRVWLGVHYPSDILAGALLGTGIGVGVHLLAPLITPGFLEPEAGTRAAPPMIQLRIRL
jgi:membrane-associated phospholipid phosphatase